MAKWPVLAIALMVIASGGGAAAWAPLQPASGRFFHCSYVFPAAARHRVSRCKV
jgi:hypothetical protein